jgi:FkbM family methyltransferase
MHTAKIIYWRTLGLPKAILTRVKRFLLPDGQGDWIFDVKVISWAFAPSLRRQLPWTHRLFVAYGLFFKYSKDGKILAGDKLFTLLAQLHRLFYSPSEILLHHDGYSIYLNPFDPRMWQVPNELSNPELDAFKLRYFLRSGDTFIDVGANHGSFSLVASHLVGSTGKVISVEPQPTLARLVKLSLRKSSKSPFVVYDFACSDHEGTADFFVPSGSSGSAGLISAFSAKEKHKAFSVPLKRFEDTIHWQSLPGRILVKLDVEGSELAFLKGARRMLLERHPMIMMEVNPTSIADAGINLSILVSYLFECGYTQYMELDQLDRRLPLGEISATPRNVLICA